MIMMLIEPTFTDKLVPVGEDSDTTEDDEDTRNTVRLNTAWNLHAHPSDFGSDAETGNESNEQEKAGLVVTSEEHSQTTKTMSCRLTFGVRGQEMQRNGRRYLVIIGTNFYALSWTFRNLLREGDECEVICVVKKRVLNVERDISHPPSAVRQVYEQLATFTKELGVTSPFRLMLSLNVVCGSLEKILLEKSHECSWTMIVNGICTHNFLDSNPKTILKHEIAPICFVRSPQRKRKTKAQRYTEQFALRKNFNKNY
ncbi:uncharacterized protein VTP21DRAFT_2707 [Calcarisporiella thermophila]|uniref:uncharacterized protein n=1 Tax=Calcarisporiella thermophila TaxID=911321 RepID=UPI00374256DB